jgi:hypothetical protein
VAALTLAGKPFTGLAYRYHDRQETGYQLYDLFALAEDGSDLRGGLERDAQDTHNRHRGAG